MRGERLHCLLYVVVFQPGCPWPAMWLACCLPVCLSIHAALLAQRCFIALHPLFAGMVIEAFRASLQAVDLAATAQYH